MLLLLIIAGCAEADTYQIGIMAPLSGARARYGKAMNVGFDAALEDLDGVNIELIYEDSNCDNKMTQTAAKKLIELDDVDIILGPYCGGPGKMASYVAQEHGKIVITPAGVGKEHAGMGSTFFRLQPEVTIEERTLVDYIFSKTDHRKFAIVYLENTFGHEYGDLFEELVLANGGQIVLKDGILITDRDFKTVTTKIAKAKPDAVFVVTSDFHAAMFVKQLRENAITLPVYSTLNTQNVKIHTIAQNAAEGIVYAFTDDVHMTAEQKAFHDRLISSGYEYPGFVEANSYDAMMLAYSALEKCGRKGLCQSAYLRSLDDYTGVSGTINFSTGDIEKSMIIKTYRDGSFVVVE